MDVKVCDRCGDSIKQNKVKLRLKERIGDKHRKGENLYVSVQTGSAWMSPDIELCYKCLVHVITMSEED